MKFSKSSIFQVLLVAIIFVMEACSPATVITGSWKNKSFVATKKYTTVFISGLTANMSAKSAIENAFYNQATQKGYKAIKSIDVFKTTFNAQNVPSEAEMLEKIRATGADIIFTIAVKDVQNQTRYVPGSTSYNPSPYGFYGYYGPVYSEVYSEGYYTNDKVYYLECNLYDAETTELIWSAQSETTNPPKMDAAAKEYAALVIYQMQKDGILK